MRKVVPFFVALHVAREQDTIIESGVQDVCLVEQQDKLYRDEQFAGADRLPEVERVQLETRKARFTRASWKGS